MLAAGTILDDRFRVDELLSRGAHAQLHGGTDLTTDHPIDVRVLHASAAASSNEMLARQMQEFRLLQNLSHPGLVRVLATGMTGDDAAYVVTEALVGQTLADVIAREGPLPADFALEILDELAPLIDMLHAKGVVHRDLRPGVIHLQDPDALAEDAAVEDYPGDADESASAIQVPDEGRPLDLKLTGFLFAKAYGEGAAAGTVTQSGSVIGTPEYMAPELAKGGRATRLADVYSLGAILFELLAGRPPIVGRNAMATMLAQVNRPPATLAEANPTVPTGPELEAFFARVLDKEPGLRPPSAAALRELFAAATENLPTSITTETGTPVAPRRPSAPTDDGVLSVGVLAASLTVLAVAGGLAAYLLLGAV